MSAVGVILLEGTGQNGIARLTVTQVRAHPGTLGSSYPHLSLLAGLWLLTRAGDLTLEGQFTFPNILGDVTASPSVGICLLQALPLCTWASLSELFQLSGYCNINNNNGCPLGLLAGFSEITISTRLAWAQAAGAGKGVAERWARWTVAGPGPLSLVLSPVAAPG